MPQLHFYVQEKFAKEIKRRADQAQLSISRYLVSLISREIRTEWPEDYFDVVFGGWEGTPLTREDQGNFEQRMGF